MNSRRHAHKAVPELSAPLCVLHAPFSVCSVLVPDLFCFLDLTFLRNSCVPDRNALNSFRFMRVRTTFFATEGWGMISSLIPSLGSLAPLFCFQSLTTIKFCNLFALITIQNAGGWYSPRCAVVKVLLELGRSFPPQPSRENPIQQRAGNSWFSRVTNHQSRVTLLRLPAPAHSHSISIGNVLQGLFLYSAEAHA